MRACILRPVLLLFGLCGFALSEAAEPRMTGVYLSKERMRFVAVDGSNDNPGTIDRPWATINYAAEQARAGQTIVIRGGHYILAAQVRPRNSGRPNAWITFIGYPGEKPILDGRSVQRASFAHGISKRGLVPT